MAVFAPGIPWVSTSLAAATVSGVGSPYFVSLAYLYFSLRDHLTFALVTEVLWERWRASSLAISVANVLEFLDGESKNNPAIKKWSPSTRTKVAQSTLAALVPVAGPRDVMQQLWDSGHGVVSSPVVVLIPGKLVERKVYSFLNCRDELMYRGDIL